MEGESLAGWPESLIATHSGLRGRPGIDLTVPVVRRVIGSFVTLLENRGAPPSVAVARDERPAGIDLASTVIAIARELGLDVRDLGAVATPTAKLAARLRELEGAVIVTASHLGPEWSGPRVVAGQRRAQQEAGAFPVNTAVFTGKTSGRVFARHGAGCRRPAGRSGPGVDQSGRSGCRGTWRRGFPGRARVEKAGL